MDTRELKDALSKGRFHKTPDGVIFPDSKILAQGVFRYNIRGQEEESSNNLVVNEGLDYLLGAAISGTSTISNWYIAVFSGDVAVQAAWTAATFAATATEFTDYDSATRPSWDKGAVASGGVDSFSSKAAFVSSVDGAVLRGAALISASTKGATTGTLIAASKFVSQKNLDTTEILDVGYGLQLTAV